MAGLRGRPIVAGAAEGEALVTRQPLSFWGGYDFKTGTIIDKHHPLAGVCAAGRVLVVPFSKGSSTTTAVLLEAARAGTAPVALLTTGADAFFALGSIVAGIMYGKSFPVVALDAEDFNGLESGVHLVIELSGLVRCLWEPVRVMPKRAPSRRATARVSSKSLAFLPAKPAY